MAQIDALNLTANLRNRMVDFALDDNFVRDDRLSKICPSIWNGNPANGGLVSDLWVEGAFPSKTSPHTLNSLVNDDKFTAQLRDVLNTPSAMPADRPLYTHQHQAIEAAHDSTPHNRPSIVVTAATGAGKTESFLLPILDDLYRNPSRDKQGAKCIILYPMNALVNDQVDRLYNLLKDQTHVSLFHFTSETPEDARRADRQGVPRWQPCRMRTRQEARGLETHAGKEANPPGPTPDIVITNYSMLEYMLCRPQDASFFGPALRSIVLDEAHLYTGTLAAEITLLLRRLLLRCELNSEDVLQIATSATLGTGDPGELRDFASQVFSKRPNKVHIIAGEPVKAPMTPAAPPSAASEAAYIAAADWPSAPTIVEDGKGNQELAINEDACNNLRQNLTALVSKTHLDSIDKNENRPAVLLHNTLSAAPLIHKLEDILWDSNHIALDKLAARLFGENAPKSTQAAAVLLRLAASARQRPASYPLVPHRIHIMVKPADGLTVCLNDRCAAPDDLSLSPLGAVTSGSQDTCAHCENAMLSLYRCDNCGQHLLAGQEHQQGSKYTPAPPFKDNNTRTFILSDAIPAPEDAALTRYINPATGESCGANHPYALSLRMQSDCPNCEASKESIRPFMSGVPLPMSIMAETLLSEMPEFPSKQDDNLWLPAAGRRLLAFSDSRREAARLGILLTNQHELQIARAAILYALENSPIGDDDALYILRRNIKRNQEDLEQPDLSAGARRVIEYELKEQHERLSRLSVGGSFDMWVGELSESETLSQMLHRPTSEDHEADKWKQLKWEDNHKEVKKDIKQILGKEFARVTPRGTTLENLGLAEITYPNLDKLTPPPVFLGGLTTEFMRDNVRKHWTNILAALCDTLRANGAVTLGDDIDNANLFGNAPIGNWASMNKRGYQLTPFIGDTSRQRNTRSQRLRFAAAVLTECGVPDTIADAKAVKLLQACFEQLLEAARDETLSWLQTEPRQTNDGAPADAVRIDFYGLAMRRPSTLFQCQKTGRIWHRSVAGCAPNSGCYGTLKAVTHDELNADPRIGRRRREYRESPIFRMGLWAEEHSAQLDPRENRRIQDLFKAGVRNILSATTTLELGIDIGGLNGVLMSNVPPGKANYLQRAGRAGRRADGSSIAATFSRPRPFDKEVFLNIGDYLAADLRKPMVFLDRKRVVKRHLNSFLLNTFISENTQRGRTGAMDAFGIMGKFCGARTVAKWDGRDKPAVDPADEDNPSERFTEFLQWLKSDGESKFREPIASISKGPADILADGWEALVQDVIDAFSNAVDDWRKDYNLLLNTWVDLPDNPRNNAPNKAQANALYYQLDTLYNLTVIEAFADRQFLPRYGFPIDVLKLGVIEYDERTKRRRQEDRFRLERDSLLALREYVPGSKLLVGGKLVISRGIRKHWTGENIDTSVGLRGRRSKCINDHDYYWISGEADMPCAICGEPPAQNSTRLIFPKYGFSSAAWDPPKWSSDTEYIGEAKTVSQTFTFHDDDIVTKDFGQVPGVIASYKENGELLVYNDGDREHEKGFAICLKCGYADSERHYDTGKINLPSGFEHHRPLFAPTREQGHCWRDGTAFVLRNETMAARQVTDVLLLDFSTCLGDARRDKALVTTLGYALQRAAVKILQLDGREIGVMTTPAGNSGDSLGALLYDNVPGGAGHVRELMARGREWLLQAKQILYISPDHDNRCQSACLDCLLSFETQQASYQGLLRRPRALSVLTDLLDGKRPSEAPPSQPQPKNYDATPASQLSPDERIRRAKAKRSARI